MVFSQVLNTISYFLLHGMFYPITLMAHVSSAFSSVSLTFHNNRNINISYVCWKLACLKGRTAPISVGFRNGEKTISLYIFNPKIIYSAALDKISQRRKLGELTSEWFYSPMNRLHNVYFKLTTPKVPRTPELYG